MVPDIPKKIELIFWDHVISAASDNSRVSNIVGKGVIFINSDPARGVRIFYGILAICGFSLGAICFLIIHPV